MAALEYTIHLNDISAVGATCNDFNIEWEDDLSCGNITCIINDNVLKVQIPESCKNECVEALITCAEPCTNCEPLRLTICPCETDADCDDCSSCIDNMCVSICKDDEFCSEGQCKECDDENPCPDGRVCVGGECVCPPGLVENDRGECVPCLPETTPNCYICTPDGIVPKECPDGQVCNPNTGDCVDCIGSGDCGENEKCEGGDCVCEEGYRRDPVTGECIPLPDCDEDADCPPCFVCNEFGDCVPKECPDGQVCVDGECKTPCEDGTDCPDGFGCNPDTGFCEECADQDCSTPDCDNLLGCNCNSSGDCVDSDNCGNQTCNNVFDCPEGCVCYKGECVDCSNFACDGCTIPGCECINGDDCVSDPDYTCEDEVRVYKKDAECDLIGEATLKDNCACDPITLTWKAISTGTEEDNRVQVSFEFNARKGKASNYNSAVQLPTLDNTSNANIADNDVPESGAVTLVQEITVVRIDENGNTIPNTQAVEVMFDETLDFSDSASQTINSLWVYKRGEEIVLNSEDHRIIGVRVKAVQNDDFNFENRSGCVYESSNTIGSISVSSTRYSSLVSGDLSIFNSFVSLFSDNARNPLFKWFRKSPNAASYNNLTDVFRKVYKSDIGGGVYRDTLFGPDEIPALNNTDLEPFEGELWSGYSYALEVDCACGDNYDNFGKVAFCQPENLERTLNSCNTTIQLGSFTVCDVNEDVTQFSNVPGKAQVFFDLYLNGQVFGTYKHDEGTNQILNVDDANESLFDEHSLVNSEEITSAKLVQRTSETELCVQEIDIPALADREVTIYDIKCNEGDNYRVEIEADQTPSDIDRIVDWGNVVNGIFSKAFPKGSPASFEVIFDDGCSKAVTLNPSCCDSRNIISTGIPAVSEGSPIPMGFEAVNLASPLTYVVYPPTLPSFNGTAPSQTNFNITIPANRVEKGDYRVVFTDGTPDCNNIEVIVNVDFLAQNEPEVITNTGEFSFCEGGSVEVFVNMESEAIGGTLKYTRTDLSSAGSPTTQGTVAIDSGQVLIEEVTKETAFQFTSLEKNGQEVFFNVPVTIEEKAKPTVSSFTVEESSICLTDDVVINIEGTPNSTVSLNQGIGDVILNASGEATVTHTPETTGTIQYSVVGLSSDSCPRENVSSPNAVVTVSEGPTIDASAECENSNPNSDKTLTWEVGDTGGTFAAFETDNETNTLSVSGGNNGDGTSTYTVTVPASSEIEVVTGEYTNASGCKVVALQAVPTNCACPNLDVDGTATSVCEGSGDNIVFTINEVVVEGVTYGTGDISVSWRDLSGTEVSTSNPYNYDSTGEAAGNIQFLYEVTIETGAHDGCSTNGSVTGSVLSPQQVDIAVSGTTGSFDGTLCDGGAMEFISTIESPTDTYSWKIDGAEVGTSRTYTFNEAAQASNYVLSVEVEDENGCTSEDDQEIFVTSCGCAVQYVDIPGAPTLDFIEFTDGQRISLSDLQVGVFPELAAGDTKNDAIVTQIENSLSANNDSGSVEVFWQYTGSTENSLRLYIFSSNYEFDFVRTELGGTTNDISFIRDCNGDEAPGCTDTGADNYNSDLVGNSSSVSIVDDGSCFNLYETALFASDIIGNTGNGATLDITIDGGTPVEVTGITQSADLVSIGSYNYNKRIVDTINGESLDVVAALPTAAELADDLAGLGTYTSPSGCGCTSRLEYIRLYWPYGSTFTIEHTTSSCGGTDLVIDNDGSFTLQKCSGGVGNTVNINAIGKTTTSVLP